MEFGKSSIVKMEKRFRRLLYCFCIFFFLYASVKGCLGPTLHLHVPLLVWFILIPIFIAISLYVGPAAHEVIESMLEEEEEGVSFQNFSPLAADIVRFVGLGLIYFFVQSGLLLLVYPEGENIRLWNVPIYIPFFVANYFLIFQFYRKYIFD
ncbi:hypothetical protein [Neobacillus cucumis]|uniref:hypothetical protein n=1 Tax=Neobacillus cucumis TaxID=1740721 RepID=UPI00196405BF|nr:hypothetical protein [Neobacillus cucumis]MBM7652999.1 hypothetical protein [Neobacillus cucumis]